MNTDFVVKRPLQGFVRITKIPESRGLSEDVRRKWVGLILPVVAIGTLFDERIRKQSEPYYYVEVEKALDVLGKEHPEIADWWREHITFEAGSGFLFKVSDTEPHGEIKDVPWQIRHHLDLLEEGVGAHDSWANQR